MQTNILCVLIGHEFKPPDARECRRPHCEFVKAGMSEDGYVNVDSLATKEIGNLRDIKEQICDLVREMGRNPVREDSHFREGWRAFAMNLSSQVMDLFTEISITDIDDQTILVTQSQEPRHQGVWKRPTTELCGRVLVGRGDDTFDPMCMLPRGHAEPCSSAPMGDPLADVSENVIEAVTSAILQQNMRPGPKLTHFMARVRAKAAIIEWRNHEDKWIREWKDENLRLQNEVLNYKIQVAGLLEKIQHDSAYKKVDGTCPACGSKGTLFLGEGGYVTCSWESCKDPCAADKLLHNDRASESMRERLSAIHSLSSPKAPNR